MLVVLRQPGVLPLFAASCVARLPMGALGLLLILHTEDRTGSYAAGGLLAGAYVLALGAAAPALARLIDRRGQTLVLRLGSVASAAAITAGALLPAGAPLAVAIGCAAVAGLAQPPVSGCMRALWPELLPGDGGRHAAYAMESVAIEVVYILGPVAIVGGLGAISLPFAMLACAAFVLAGDWAFAAHPRSRAWRAAVREHHGLLGPLRSEGVRVLVLLFALCGLAVGAVEIVVAASVGGDEQRSGVLLGLWGAGSLLAGLVVARLGAAPDGPRRLGLLVGAWGATHALVGLADSPVVLGVLLLAAGATIAPTFVTANSMLDHLAPEGTLTEAFTWTSTGITAGISLGSVAGGALVESASPGLAMLALGGVTALGGVLAIWRQAALRPAATLAPV